MIRVVVLVLVVLLSGCAQAGVEPLRVMTYNIRLDLASDGDNDWAHRRDHNATVIAYQAPDLIGLQEVLLGQKRDLEAALPAYAMLGVGRDDGKDAGEFSPLGYRTKRFDVLASDSFWLSPTPSVPGKGWDAAYPRVATWAVLRDKASGRRVRVLNSHFDHVGTEARMQSARMIAAWVAMGEGRALPTIVMGDFNTTPDGEPYRILAETPATGLRDARLASTMAPYGPPGTFNAFRIDSDAAAPIDHVFVSPGIAVASYGVITQHWGGRLPSDHYPVVVDLALPRR